MKFLAVILSFYVNLLSLIPTVTVINMTWELKCHDVCCGKILEEDPNGCQKEKCLVNLNFHSTPFLVFSAEYSLSDFYADGSDKESIPYRNPFLSNFKAVIWQPPEFYRNT